MRVGRRSLCVGTTCVLTALLSPRVAGAAAPAQAARYAVTWTTGDGAASCAQQAEMTAAIGRLVSADHLTAPEHADRFIVGTVSRLGAWRAQFAVRDAAGNVLGEREIESNATSCSELDSAAALAIALIVDPERSESPAQPAATSAPPRQAAAPLPVQVVAATPARVVQDATRVPVSFRSAASRRTRSFWQASYPRLRSAPSSSFGYRSWERARCALPSHTSCHRRSTSRTAHKQLLRSTRVRCVSLTAPCSSRARSFRCLGAQALSRGSWSPAVMAAATAELPREGYSRWTARSPSIGGCSGLGR